MNFVVALKAEAGPLIQRLKLSKQSSDPFPLFVNDEHRLVLSGPGKELSAKAVKYLAERCPQPNQAWLNLGLAGHGTLGVGKIFLANRVLDDKERTFYPTQILRNNLRSTALMSGASPVSDYPEPIGYDMEASAFCENASRFSVRELIQVVKIVSDNPDHPVETFDRSSASTLIENSLSLILPLIAQLQQISQRAEPSTELTKLIESVLSLFPFSETQHHQVRKLLRHARSVGLSAKEAMDAAKEGQSAKEAISCLHRKVDPHRELP